MRCVRTFAKDDHHELSCWNAAGKASRCCRNRGQPAGRKRAGPEDRDRRLTTSARQASGGSRDRVHLAPTTRQPIFDVEPRARPRFRLSPRPPPAARASGMAKSRRSGRPRRPSLHRQILRLHPAHPGVKYPEPYMTTNTVDDHDDPGHARDFAAEFEALGDPYLYYQNTPAATPTTPIPSSTSGAGRGTMCIWRRS